MLVLCVLLLMAKDCFSQTSEAFEKPRNVKQYVEARNDFTRAKLFIQSRLPLDVDITNAENQYHVNFGVLAAVIGGLVEARAKKTSAEDLPLQVVLEYAPYAKENYATIANATHFILEDLTDSVKSFFDFMDKLCEEEYDCNILLDSALTVKPNPQKEQARLLRRLQNVAKYVNQNAKLIDKIIREPDVEPYLLDHVDDDAMTKFVKELTKVYKEFNW